MARVPYTGVPEAQAQPTAPEDYQHIDAQPAAFGGEVAQGMQKAGEGALTAARFYEQAAADNGTNNAMQQVTNVLYGDPSKTTMGPDGKPVPDTGYFGLRGSDAMAQRGAIAQHIDDIIAENRESLQTPRSRQQFDVDTRRLRAQWQAEMGRHADEQAKVWGADTNNTGATLWLNTAARDPGNETVAAQAQEGVRKFFTRNAQLAGEDTEGAVLKADQSVLTARLKSLAITNPGAAQKLFADKGSILASLPDYDQLGRTIKTQVVESGIAPLVDAHVNAALAQAAAATQAGQAGAAGIVDMIPGLERSASNAVSQKGAIGKYQITPDTAHTYGLDPAKLTDEAYAKAAAATIVAGNIKKIGSTRQDDLLVAYNAGPEVAKQWIAGGRNPAALSAETRDYLARANLSSGTGASGAPGQQLSVPDTLRLNEASILDGVRADARKTFGDQYPDAVERTVTAARRRLDQTIAQQDQQYIVASHIVQRAMDSDHPPTSESDLIAMGPQMAQAWRTMQFTNWGGTIATRNMFDAAARGLDPTFGTAFHSYLLRAL